MFRGGIILAITSVLSYAFGLLRDRALAGTFGATGLRDVYEASFIVPDFIFNLFLAGALVSAFVPVFTDLLTHKKDKEARELAGSLFTFGLLILLCVGVVTFFFAKPLAAIVGPGFSLEKQTELASLMRLMLLSPLLFLVSNLLGGMLISTERFLAYGLSPILYNLGIVGGAIFLTPYLGIRGVVVGTLVGAVFHMGVRVIGLWRGRLRLVPNFRVTPELKRVVLLMIPRVLGLTVGQIELWVFLAIGSTLGEGAVTVNNIARNFQSFPVSILGIAFATSLFPLLSKSGSVGNSIAYARDLRRGILLTLASVLPATALLYFFREQVITLFLGTGAFDSDAVKRTAVVLGVYALSIPAESLVHVLTRAFYALQNTLLPMIINFVAIAVSIATTITLTPRLGIVGIPTGFTVGAFLQVLILGAVLLWYAPRALRKRAL